MIETGKYREAAEEFKKASYWNPTSAFARFQYVVALIKLGVYKNAWRISIDNMKYLFRKNDISQCYYHLALSYDAGGCIEAAIACLYLSKSYSTNWDKEDYLQETMKEANMKPSHFTVERINKLSEEYEFPLYPEETAIKLAYKIGVAKIDEDPELAVYYLSIARDLVDAPELEEKLAMAEKRLGIVRQEE